MFYTNNDLFLSELSKIFEVGRQKGKSVWISIKRYDGRTTRNPRKPNDRPKKPISRQGGDLMPNEYKCLIRAKLGDRKISAAISHKDMNKFQSSYSSLIKGNIIGLKKQKTNPSSSSTSNSVQQKQTSSKGSAGGSSSINK